ncbi:protein UXT [Trypanosoma conorhini]|uniref:Protein UXT n=1 Tax=Trypanosoma conorhini TaxID=83891 RepID=A0A3R7PHA0_9TRYP|nr:protein UXT [Trypanosoma conorhini]RNF19916.1 protein UXT [Trypanosoma conorhini]
MPAEADSHAPPASFDAETGSMARLEHFLDAVLRQSLERVLRERDTVYAMASDCCQLRELFEEMRALSSTHSFIAEGEASSAAAAAGGEAERRPQRNQIMVDIGNHFFVQCAVRDASQVWVNLGCGVVLPMSTAEADAFMQKKEKLLRERAARLSKEALRIKYRIRLVMEAITRLYDRATGQRA